MICARCCKELEPSDDVFVVLDNWLQWEHYAKIGEHAGCYCSYECFANDWSVERFTVEEYEEEFE